MLVDTKLGTKVSLGGMLDSSSALGEVNESYLIQWIKPKWLWNIALFVIKFLQDNQVGGITERYNIQAVEGIHLLKWFLYFRSDWGRRNGYAFDG